MTEKQFRRNQCKVEIRIFLVFIVVVNAVFYGLCSNIEKVYSEDYSMLYKKGGVTYRMDQNSIQIVYPYKSKP